MPFSFFISKKQTYYRWIILFMVLFALVLFIPYTIASYNIAKKNISDSIEFSNTQVFSQMDYNYRFNSELMANICLEIFFSNNVQQFLYNQDIDYFNIYTYMRNLANTTVLTHASIDSIVLYNSYRAEWFSTNPNLPPGQDILPFISQRESIPRLKPLLRQKTRSQGNITVSYWVYSYFMYQFSDPVENRDSYVLINQNASWFVDNLILIQQAGNQINAVYLLNESGIVYRSHSAVPPEAEGQLVNYFLQKEKSNDSNFFYEQRIVGNRYLISFFQMGEDENYLLLVRNYDDVFGSLINLQRDYLLFGAAFLFVIGLLSIPFSRRIYFPLKNFLSYITNNEKEMELSPNMGNEFVYLHNLYWNARELNKRLHEQSAAYEPLFEERKLFGLINDSGGNAYFRFREALPDHWLSLKAGLLRIALFRLDRFKEKNLFEKTDIFLFFQAIKNIIYRNLDDGWQAAFFQEGAESLGAILHMENTGEDELFEFMENCRISIKHHLDITISVSYSGLSAEALNLNSLYREAKELLQYRFVFGQGAIIGKKHCLLNLENKEIQYPNELDERLISAIREKNLSLILTTLEDIKNQLRSFQYAHINICSMALVNNVIMILNEVNSSAGKADTADFYQRITNMEFMDDFFDDLKTYILASLGNVELETQNRLEKNIRDIMNFVQDNYSNPNLSSQLIGDSLGFSNRYLMYKFLECTGTTLTEYIINVRMRKAAGLLLNTVLPIREIAEQIGIQNDNYFYRLFRQVYHCTPREFTEQYTSGNGA